MKLASKLLLGIALTLFAGCSSPRGGAPAKDQFKETCPDCGHVAYFYPTYDARDYEVLGFICNSSKPRARLYYRGPNGPSLSHNDTWTSERISRLREALPALRSDTVKSFLERNKVAPQHAIDSFQPAAGPVVRITRTPGGESLSRVGFSRNGDQALVYDGRNFALYVRAPHSWAKVGNYQVWRPLCGF
jgi:hypothetical protein